MILTSIVKVAEKQYFYLLISYETQNMITTFIVLSFSVEISKKYILLLESTQFVLKFLIWNALVVRSSNLEDKLAFGFRDSLMFKVFSDLGIVEKQFYN